jgi:hypothetical protein
MIIFLDRSKPIILRYALSERVRNWGLSLLRAASAPYGGSLMVKNNLFRELSLEKGLNWAAGQGAEPQETYAAAWVLSSLHDLRHAIHLKKEGRIKKLWAGPNLIVVPQEAEPLLQSEHIDAHVVPCAWVRDLYAQQAPYLKEKLTIWPVGIDTAFWNTDPSTYEKTQVLIYNKNQSELSNALSKHLMALNIPVKHLNYGHYTPEEYRRELNKSQALVWLSRAETQGLAYLEALSMNVPVIAWDAGRWDYESPVVKKYFSSPSTSVPYFDASCGEVFSTAAEFSGAFGRFAARRAKYQPRAWLESQNMDLPTNLQRFAPLQSL